MIESMQTLLIRQLKEGHNDNTNSPNNHNAIFHLFMAVVVFLSPVTKYGENMLLATDEKEDKTTTK